MKKISLLAFMALPMLSFSAMAESKGKVDSESAEETAEKASFDPKGYWFTGEKRSKVEIKPCAGDASKLCGTIIALKEPNEPSTGNPKVDLETKEPMMGLEVFKDFTNDGDNEWSGGTIRDPKEGKTYSAKFTMKSNNEMDLRGFIGISLLGRTQEWFRTTKDSTF